MKKQITMLLALLMTSVAVVALAGFPDPTALTYYTVTVEVSPAGAGTVNPTSSRKLSGTNGTFTATANAGYSFEGWYLGDTQLSTDNPYTHKHTANVTITARFKAEAAHTVLGFIKASSKGMGSVSVEPTGTATEGGYKYNHGSSVTVTATAYKGHRFERWEDGAGNTLSTSATYAFTVNDDMAVYAVFSQLPNYKDDLVSFPGAEGWGRFTTGGRMIDDRGAKVYYVTRLDDCTNDNLVEGTLRWAMRTGDDTPRTILFKVSGTIYLTSRLDAAHPNVTIAGQTAPGGGICIGGYPIKLNKPNTIVRHIRFRAGDLQKTSVTALDAENTHHMMFDHCSFTWSMEENLTMYDCDSTTVQWCILGEALYNSRNAKGARAYATQWGGEHGTMHHCLITNCYNRAPRFNGVRTSEDLHADDEFINNVIYNWGKPNSIYGGECYDYRLTTTPDAYCRTYMINNYFRPGPITKENVTGNRYFVGASYWSAQKTDGVPNWKGAGQWYLSGNKFEVDSKWRPTNSKWNKDVLEKVNADNMYGFVNNSSDRAFDLEELGGSQANYDKYILTSQTLSSGVTIESADDAFRSVTTKAGASLPRYDEVDARLLAEAAGTQDPQFGGDLGKKGIIDTPKDITLQSHDEFSALYEGDNADNNEEVDVTWYPRLQGDSYDCGATDTDGDGLPDSYETATGLNPNDGSDGMQLTESGYSNLEVFLNGVADGTIDMKQYTRHQADATLTAFNAIVAKDGSGNYTTVQAAVNAAPTDGTPYYIFVKAGEYNEHVAIDKSNVHLTGQSRENTIIWDNKTNNDDGGVDKAATINVTGNDVSFDNLTIRNTRTDKQAVALYSKGDRIRITSCNLDGWQDTYRTGKDGQRHIVRNSTISGKTDFIYGAGEVFFDGVTLMLTGQGWIVAPDHQSPRYGYVFNNAIIKSKSGTVSNTHLGRPWGNTPMVSYLNTSVASGVTIAAEGWAEMGGKPKQMAEYNTTDANGNAIDLSQRRTSFGGTDSKAVIGKVEADSYKLDYVLRGSDNWDADWQAFILPAPRFLKSEGILGWYDPTGFANCWLVEVDGQATVTTDTSRTDDGKKVVVRPISAYGVLGEPAASDDPTRISTAKRTADVVSRQYFTADGRQVQHLQHGLNLIREFMADGTTNTFKLVVK